MTFPGGGIRAFVAIGAGTLATALAVLGFAAANPAFASASSPSSPDAVRAYWTAERMEAAVPLDNPTGGSPSDPNAAGTPDSSALIASARRERVRAKRIKNPRTVKMRRHGRIFGTLEGLGDYSCSGTSVRAPNRSLVWTAAHCLAFSELGTYVDNVAFVPAYRKGNAPFGIWPATTMKVPLAWMDASGYFGPYGSQLDYGAAVVAPNTEDQRLAEVVGARKIAFNTSRKVKLKVYGYPAQYQFSGEQMYVCETRYGGPDRQMPRPYPMRIACDMTGGSSGGAWIGRRGRLVSVISYGPGYGDILFGPYQGKTARRIYDSARFIQP